MSWLTKFFHLIYVAYLDCEKTLRDVSFITAGVFAGFFLIVAGVEYLPPDYTPLAYLLVAITLINVGIITTLLFQYIVSIIFCISMIKVAYLYDRRSWGCVHAIKKLLFKIKNHIIIYFRALMDQLLKDEHENRYKSGLHEDMIKNEVEKVRNH